MPLFLTSVLLLLLGGSSDAFFAVPPLPAPRKLSSVSSVTSISSSSSSQTNSTTGSTSSTDHHDHTSAFSSRFYPQSRIPFRKRRSDESVRAPVKWSGLPLYHAYLRHRFVSQQQQKQQPPNTHAPLHDQLQIEWWDRTHPYRYPTPTPTPSASFKSKYDSVWTMACLWNIVGNFTNTTMAPSRHSMATTRNCHNYTQVVALPDFDPYLVEQFVTMVQWLLRMVPTTNTSTTAAASWDISYRNTVVDFTTIPTLIMTQLSYYYANTDKDDEQQDDASRTTTKTPPPPTATIRYDHECITSRTKSWVQRLLVEHTICPFTKSTKYSGQGLSNVPVGAIAYHTSQSSALLLSSSSSSLDSTTVVPVATLQSDIWWAIHDMLLAGPTYRNNHNERLNGISSILLAAPGWDDHLDMWTRIIFPICEATIQVLDLTEEIGVVCFHPHYQTPDGRSFPGFGHMHSVPRLQQWLQDHRPFEDVEMAIQRSIPDFTTANVMSGRTLQTATNDDSLAGTDNDDGADPQHFQLLQALAAAGGAWQRRTPHATINVLRADQLAAAESRRSSPTFYSNNILRLSRIGWSQLQQALDDDRNIQKTI